MIVSLLPSMVDEGMKALLDIVEAEDRREGISRTLSSAIHNLRYKVARHNFGCKNFNRNQTCGSNHNVRDGLFC